MAMTSTMQLLVLSFLVIASLFLGATVAPPASLISTPDQVTRKTFILFVCPLIDFFLFCIRESNF